MTCFRITLWPNELPLSSLYIWNCGPQKQKSLFRITLKLYRIWIQVFCFDEDNSRGHGVIMVIWKCWWCILILLKYSPPAVCLCLALNVKPNSSNCSHLKWAVTAAYLHVAAWARTGSRTDGGFLTGVTRAGGGHHHLDLLVMYYIGIRDPVPGRILIPGGWGGMLTGAYVPGVKGVGEGPGTNGL